MGTHIFSATQSNNTDANFRAWGGGTSAAWDSCGGFAKTADTGQIDWTTVVAPSAANTSQGYEIRAFADTLQGTFPVVVKIEYGSSAGIATRSGLWLTVGTGSNGSGTITGIFFARVQVINSGTDETTVLGNSFVSTGDGSMAGLCYRPTSGNAAYYGTLILERSRDSSGAITGIGMVVFFGQANVYEYHIINCASGATRTLLASSGGQSSNIFAFPIDYTGSTGFAAGGSAPLFPGLVCDPVNNFWQPRSFLAYHYVDLGSCITVALPGYGSYLPLGAASQYVLGSNATAARLAMMWQ